MAEDRMHVVAPWCCSMAIPYDAGSLYLPRFCIFRPLGGSAID